LITDNYREAWRELLLGLGYRSYHAVDAFEQFEPVDPMATVGPAPGIDLMLVDRSTWDKLYPAANRVALDEGETVRVPDPLHLIAMKLNAARNPHRRVGASDIGDVIALVKACGLDLNDPGFVAVLERYGSPESVAAIRQALALPGRG
jgi:hypothetical protein